MYADCPKCGLTTFHFLGMCTNPSCMNAVANGTTLVIERDKDKDK